MCSVHEAARLHLTQLQDQHAFADSGHGTAQLPEAHRPVLQREQDQALPLAAHDGDGGVETAWAAPLYELVRRAADAGHAEHSISALTEVLRR
jgi:hypothetical protein